MQELITEIQDILDELYGKGWEQLPDRPYMDDLQSESWKIINEILDHPEQRERFLQRLGIVTLIIDFLVHSENKEFSFIREHPEIAVIVLTRMTIDGDIAWLHGWIADPKCQGMSRVSAQESLDQIQSIRHLWDSRLS